MASWLIRKPKLLDSVYELFMKNPYSCKAITGGGSIVQICLISNEFTNHCYIINVDNCSLSVEAVQNYDEMYEIGAIS